MKKKKIKDGPHVIRDPDSDSITLKEHYKNKKNLSIKEVCTPAF